VQEYSLSISGAQGKNAANANQRDDQLRVQTEFDFQSGQADRAIRWLLTAGFPRINLQ
jgi:hypothetical protein